MHLAKRVAQQRSDAAQMKLRVCCGSGCALERGDPVSTCTHKVLSAPPWAFLLRGSPWG